MKEVVIGIVLSIVAFLAIAFFSSFVTKADYNSDRAAILLMGSDIKYIRERLDDHINAKKP